VDPTYIFISHSSKDNEFGLKLAQDLRQALGTSHIVWYDALSIRPGEEWLHSISKQIEHCTFFILIASPDSMKSQWVEKEFHAAFLREKRILPLLWKECKRWLFLETLQHIDFCNEEYATALNNLLAELKTPFGMEAPPASGEPPTATEEQISKRVIEMRKANQEQAWEKVLKWTEAIQEQFPGAVPAEAYYLQGRAFFKLGDFVQAENALNMALAVVSEKDLHLKCLQELKDVLEQTEDRWEDLLRVAESALLLVPDNKEWKRLYQQARGMTDGPRRRIRPLPAPKPEYISTFRGHSGTIYDIAWSPNGQELASASGDKTVRIWSIEGSEDEPTYVYEQHKGRVNAVDWSPINNWIASASVDKTVHIWHPEHGKRLQWKHKDLVNDVAWSPDGHYVASASDDKTVQVWDIQAEKCIAVYNEHRHWVNIVAWSPDGKRIASGSQDRTIHIWNVNPIRNELIFPHHTASINDLLWSPGGTDIASASTDKTVRIWSTTGAPGFTVQSHNDYVLSLTRSRYGRRIASASNGTITVWYTATRNIIFINPVHTGFVWTVAWSPDDRYIASAGEDRLIQIWSVIDDVV
jgi:WD40 repeat protein